MAHRSRIRVRAPAPTRRHITAVRLATGQRQLPTPPTQVHRPARGRGSFRRAPRRRPARHAPWSDPEGV